MTVGKRFLISLLIALAVWAVFTWPLPRHVMDGIPSSDRNVEKNHVRKMIEGDHLQLLYHFQLAADMVSGKIPLFFNIYEFNTGDDAERYRPDPYYAPFSLIYALGALAAGQPFGWNLAGFLSILLTYFLTWELVRRYVPDRGVSALAALIAFMFPYRWITLLSGSPTGFAMAFPPALLLGLDMAVRDQRFTGGLLAGAAVFFSYCSDLHVFFFSVLVAPFWCLVAVVWWPDFCSTKRGAVLRLLAALLPLAVLAAAAVGLSMLLQRFAGTDMAHGRSWEDVRLFSPVKAGLLSWRNLGVSNHVFFGGTMAVLLLSGLLTRSFAAAGIVPERPGSGSGDMWAHPRRSAAFVLLCAGMAGIVMLALGVNGPFEGAVMRLCRAAIPHYDMIRQPVKIFCVLPPVMAVAVGLTLTSWTRYVRGRRLGVFCAAAVLAAVGVEYRFQVSPTICLLEREQAAYQAVAEDAERDGTVPRALVIPLWPGDSHYTSLYQYYASLYGIRMINGYSPVIDHDYFRNVFRRFESANLGVLSDEQLDALLADGIACLLFHETPFPEKVSPFPAGFTLQRLLKHRRLAPLRQDGAVWAFRILVEDSDDQPAETGWEFFAPARMREAERLVHPESGIAVLADPGASAGLFARLCGTPLTVSAGQAPLAPRLRWILRVRGKGRFNHVMESDQAVFSRGSLALARQDWHWIEIPVPLPAEAAVVDLELALASGTVDVDLAVLAAGEWPGIPEHAEVIIPAPCFFRAGYTDTATGSVVLRKDYEPDRAVFYGPNMPLAPGEYRVSLDCASDAPAGTVLGKVNLAGQAGASAEKSVVAGKPFEMNFKCVNNLPVRADFVFSRNADVRLSRVVFEPVKD